MCTSWSTSLRVFGLSGSHKQELFTPGSQLGVLVTVWKVPLSFRYKGRRLESHAPHVPNQPSEAAAHFYFELAKTVLIKAGGNSSTSIFTHPSSSGGHQGPHRNLHLCAFEIGLYALGLHNFVSPNWLSRTYSSHVSWITGYSKSLLGSLRSDREKEREASLFPKIMMMVCFGIYICCWHSWQ